MLGTVRLVLAMMVALSHVGWYPGFNPGIVAVVIFYMISGYAMAALWRSLQQKSRTPFRHFAWDRLLRIYPPYLVVLILTALLVLWIHPPSYFLSAQGDTWLLLQNMLIVPLNYYMFSGIDRFTLIPPAWSLAVELQFYLLLPLLLIRWPRFFYWLSLGVAIYAQLGGLPREWFTYRLLPGVLHLFLAGVLLAQAPDRASRRRLLIKMLLLYCSLFALAWVFNLWSAYRTPQAGAMFNLLPELTLGVLIGLPIVALLAPLRGHHFKGWLKRLAQIDHVLGYLSYSAFLVHFGVYWWLTRHGPAFDVHEFVTLTLLFAIIIGFGVEFPAQRLRKKLVTNDTGNKRG